MFINNDKPQNQLLVILLQDTTEVHNSTIVISRNGAGKNSSVYEKCILQKAK